MKHRLLTVLIAILSGHAAHAAGVISGLTADSGINNTPALRSVTNIDEVAKARNANSNARNAVYVFQLPDLGPGQTFNTATLSFSLLQNGTSQVAGGTFGASTNPDFNLDIYGLGARATSTVAVGDVYFGAVADPSDATLLQADFITSTTSVGTVSLSGASLVTYLNAQYSGGAGIGNFLFIRLNPDAAAGSDTTNNMNYRFSMADNTGTTAYAKIVPQIAWTSIPEPATALLSGIGLLAFAPPPLIASSLVRFPLANAMKVGPWWLGNARPLPVISNLNSPFTNLHS